MWTSKLKWILVGLGLVAALFHFWYEQRMPGLSPTGEYFLASGALFVVASLLVAWKGTGFLFKLGAAGLFVLSAIDNVLLYYTRTYGFGVLSSIIGTRRFSGNFTHPPPLGNITTSRLPINSTVVFRHAPSGGGGGWASSWNPPGPLQFFVLQVVIMAVVVVAALPVLMSRAPEVAESGSSPGPT